MSMNLKMRAFSLVASVGLLGGTAFVASGQTGAYFSDTHTGTISGTIGTIKVTPGGGTGGENMDIAFSNLLPGAPQTVSSTYTNSGSSTEDVWVVFNNATALSAFNNLGSYATVHLSSTGSGSVGDVFDSANLDDRLATCGSFSPTGCWPMMSAYKIASNLAPGGAGTFHFNYMLASAISTQPATPVAWNTYPLPGWKSDGVDWNTCVTTEGGSHTDCSNNQTTVNASDGTGSGLPYQIVATQPGIQPGAVGTHP